MNQLPTLLGEVVGDYRIDVANVWFPAATAVARRSITDAIRTLDADRMVVNASS